MASSDSSDSEVIVVTPDSIPAAAAARRESSEEVETDAKLSPRALDFEQQGNDMDCEEEEEKFHAARTLRSRNPPKRLADEQQPPDPPEDTKRPPDIMASTRRVRRPPKSPAQAPKDAKWPEDIAAEEKLTNLKGFKICKYFEDAERYFDGQVICEEPAEVVDEDTREMVLTWRVRYTDGDEEDLTRAQLEEWDARNKRRKAAAITITTTAAASAARSGGVSATAVKVETEPPKKKQARKGGKKVVDSQHSCYEAAKRDLCFRMGVSRKEVVQALKSMNGPPYGLNEAMHIIHKNKVAKDNHPLEEDEASYGKFVPFKGMRVLKFCEGWSFEGEVTNDGEMYTITVDDPDAPNSTRKVRMWEVTYDHDGSKDDMSWDELLRWRASRPNRPDPCRGRQLSSVELFGGCCRVTQEFCERKWRVRSIDNDPQSHATDVVDIFKLRWKDIGPHVPDFVWMSPPCFTYSNLSGGKHRNASKGQYEKTEEAHIHNSILARLAFIMRFVKKFKPHAIFVIENPVGTLSHMPLMHHIVKEFQLYKAQVHYCAFERDDKKPTLLWTNSFDLKGRLNQFQCGPTCPYYDRPHPIGARSNGAQYNAAAIPRYLAEEVAEFVTSKFYHDRVSYTKEVKLTAKQEEEFNRGLCDVELTAKQKQKVDRSLRDDVVVVDDEP